MKADIRVVAGIILRPQDKQILMCQRTDADHFGLWEFPGGKLEAGESHEQALYRELDEELGIQIKAPCLFESFVYAYPKKTIDLSFFTISAYQGIAHGREQQPLQWFKLEELAGLEMLEANSRIIDKLDKIFD